jgi:hypothetical protein
VKKTKSKVDTGQPTGDGPQPVASHIKIIEPSTGGSAINKSEGKFCRLFFCVCESELVLAGLRLCSTD